MRTYCRCMYNKLFIIILSIQHPSFSIGQAIQFVPTHILYIHISNFYFQSSIYPFTTIPIYSSSSSTIHIIIQTSICSTLPTVNPKHKPIMYPFIHAYYHMTFYPSIHPSIHVSIHPINQASIQISTYSIHYFPHIHPFIQVFFYPCVYLFNETTMDLITISRLSKFTPNKLS